MGQVLSCLQAPDYEIRNGFVTLKIIKAPSCIYIHYFGRAFIARISHGTEFSFCHEKFLEAVKFSSPFYTNTVETITAPNGWVYEVVGQAQFNIFIGCILVNHKFYIVKESKEDFLIGKDIIQKLGGIEYKDFGKKVTFRNL